MFVKSIKLKTVTYNLLISVGKASFASPGGVEKDREKVANPVINGKSFSIGSLLADLFDIESRLKEAMASFQRRFDRKRATSA